MIRNYLITALRNLARHKLYSFINIAGLAVGLACAVFIILFLRDELSYDAWIPDTQNLYRVESVFTPPGIDPAFFTVTPFPVPPTMLAEIPGVVAQTHLIPNNFTAKVGDRQFPVNVDAADPNFFQVIRLPFVRGNPAIALAQPESIVLTQAAAKKFFGAADPIGRTVTLDGAHALTVTGILRDLPHNTDLNIDMVVPNTSQVDRMSIEGRGAWLNIQGAGYVKLAPNANLAAVQAKLGPMLDRHIDAKKQLNVDVPGHDMLHLHLIPFRAVHLAPFGETKLGRWTTVYGFAAVALLIVLIACINYMNLATARALARSREVSLRKVMGARRSQLIVQFLGESIMMALIALLFAVAMVELLTPAFDTLLARPIAYRILSDWPLTLFILGTAILAGVLGGSYPAFLLSSTRPAARLGTGATAASGSGLLRTTLVVLQFAISIGLGIAVIVIFAQISFSRQMNIGFDRHNLLVINGAGQLTPTARDSLDRTLAADPAIAGVAQSDMTPFDGGILVSNVTLPDSGEKFTVRYLDIDPDFLGVYGIKLLAGRNLSRDRGTDIYNPPEAKPGVKRAAVSMNVLIDAAAARQFGFTVQNAIGRTLILDGLDHMTIAGVVGDVNFDGLQQPMQPIFYSYAPKGLGPLSVRIKPGQTQAAVAAVDRIWRRFMPSTAIRRRFQDESFDKFFNSDEREGRIFGIFVGIAIFIACLGLFGLASFTAERRTKEIGVRKVYGARTRDIVRLLLWQFSKPVLIANLIAWPVAWYYLQDWLTGYAYRIPLSPFYFLAAGIIALLIAWVTVIFHTVLIARASPIHALRYE
jgi:putative ABC transport system permease protein